MDNDKFEDGLKQLLESFEVTATPPKAPSNVCHRIGRFRVMTLEWRTHRKNDGFDLRWIWGVANFDQFDQIRQSMSTGDIGALRAVAQENQAIKWQSVIQDFRGYNDVSSDAMLYVASVCGWPLEDLVASGDVNYDEKSEEDAQ